MSGVDWRSHFARRSSTPPIQTTVMRILIVAAALFAVSSAPSAQTRLPNTFAPGQPAKAAEVNENFEALARAIDSLRIRVARLEALSTATGAVITGDYSFVGLVPSLRAKPGESAAISHGSVTDGSVSLQANGTYSSSFTITETYVTIDDWDGYSFATRRSPQVDGGTWSQTSLGITLTSAQGMGVIPLIRAGPRLFVHMVEDPHSATDRSQRLLFLIGK